MVFVVINENKTKKIEGLVHVRIVHFSYPTGVKSVDWRSLFCPSTHSFVISETFFRRRVSNVPMYNIHFIDTESVESSLKVSHLSRGSW